MDIERLKVDREYWDSVAPDGARWYYEPSSDWYMEGVRGILAWHALPTAWAPAVNDSRVHRGQCITRPETRQVEWDGEGLPPVGTRCMGKPDDYDRPVEGVVIWHIEKPENHSLPDFLHDTIFLVDGGGVEYCSKFESIPTKEQRERDELAELCKQYIVADDYGTNLADAIIAEGWRKDQ